MSAFLPFPPCISHLLKRSSILQISLMKFRKAKSISSTQSKSVAEYDINFTYYYKVNIFFYVLQNFRIKSSAINLVSHRILEPSRWLGFFNFFFLAQLYPIHQSPCPSYYLRSLLKYTLCSELC